MLNFFGLKQYSTKRERLPLEVKVRGIAFLPVLLVHEALEIGQLITLLDDYLDRQMVFWM